MTQYCTWRRGRKGGWFPSCKHDYKDSKHPDEEGDKAFCKLCGRRIRVDRENFVSAWQESKANEVCPCCGMRCIENREYGWCYDCIARYSDDIEKRTVAIKTLRAREKRRVSNEAAF